MTGSISRHHWDEPNEDAVRFDMFEGMPKRRTLSERVTDVAKNYYLQTHSRAKALHDAGHEVGSSYMNSPNGMGRGYRCRRVFILKDTNNPLEQYRYRRTYKIAVAINLVEKKVMTIDDPFAKVGVLK